MLSLRAIFIASCCVAALVFFVHGNDSSLLPEHPRSAGVAGKPFESAYPVAPGDSSSVGRDAAPALVAPPVSLPVIVEPMSPQTTNPPATTGLEPCGGGDYPPCSVVQRESRGSYTAINPTGCGGYGCFGKWQFSGEWAGKLGLPVDIAAATPAQQDEAARELWSGGAGCSNWAAC